MRSILATALSLALLAALGPLRPGSSPATAPAADLLRPPHGGVASAARTVQAVRFLPNLGQWTREVAYGVLGETAGWVHGDGFTLRLARCAARTGRDPRAREQTGGIVRTRFRGTARTIEAGERLPGEYNFLRGADPAGWFHGIEACDSVTLRELLPGIDVVFRALPSGAAEIFAYDLLLAPGADLASFEARCEGVESLRVDELGQLRLCVPTPDGTVELVQRAPIAWQDLPGGRQPVRVTFRLLGGNRYGFAARGLDPAHAATIDPGVVWSTYLGGGRSDSINDLVWRQGSGIWVAGWAASLDFPTTTGAYRSTGGQDGFVARLGENGSTLVYGTYLGGALGDEVRGIGLGPGLQPTVVGFTRSLDFPVTAGALQPTFRGASLVIDLGDAFVARLDANGSSLLGGTYLGGLADEVAEAVAVDAGGNAYVAGWTMSPDFPTTPNVLQPLFGGPVTQADGFVARIASNCASAVYSTFLGGNLPDQMTDLALDPATGQVVVVGWTVSANYPVSGTAYRTTNTGSVDMVVTRLAANAATAVFSTYFGGQEEDLAHCVAIAADGTVWVGGTSDSTNLPTTAGAPQRTAGGLDDGVVLRLSATGAQLPFATRFGGPGADQVRGIAVDGSDVLVVGETTGGIPVTPLAYQSSFAGGGLDGFVAHYTGSGAALAYASYFGGSNQDVLDSVVLGVGGLAVVGGWSFASDFPVTPGAFQTQLRGVEDGVLWKLDLLADLDGGIELGAAGGGGVRLVEAGEHEALAALLTNRTQRPLQVEALRLLVAGRGAAPAQVAGLSVFLDDPATPAQRDRRVAGPLPVLADDAETTMPLQDLWLEPGASATLRVVLDLLPGPGTTIECACALAEGSALSVRAAGAGAGPAVRVLGNGRVDGPVLVLGALPGDADGDGTISVFDLRRLCTQLGAPGLLHDVDGDGVATTDDVDYARAAMVGRPTLLGLPLAIARGGWFTLSGLFPAGGLVEATLGGRSLLLGRVTPREITLRVDPNQAPGMQGFTLAIDGRIVAVRPVQVQ